MFKRLINFFRKKTVDEYEEYDEYLERAASFKNKELNMYSF